MRNLTELPSIVVSKCKWNGSEDDVIMAMVNIVMLRNDIPYVWRRLVANLEMNSYN